MKNVSFFLLIIIFCSAGLFSCGNKNDDPGCSVAWATDLQKELTAITAAVTAYSADRSAANCTALKAAYQDYIDALKPYGDCATLTGQSRTDWQKAVSDAEASIDSMC